ncbi:MAG: class I SAM-dependent methyltransferase [Humidesulfovibrio sp.]|uniref:class I SAM-dependent methyltransferase n=1 Tax=Humidesulfovibrio sp. TaxID=2910988 RepID=UPI0027FFFFA3|nr:class I SAM-dependent methyltransferase [Humidesulfovibrio sp.]MDQ7834273.1 class I SAM-dependent methyltransferase [Humidesulfovibrio sp.]
MSGHWQAEVAQGQRFEFGSNWALFLRRLDEKRIRAAEDSLKELLDLSSLAGRTFLDAGSGSGLFSLAASRLGAAVISFDYDPASVACTSHLRNSIAADDASWTVLEGSVLDQSFLESLGRFDVVYSWGVLHHTGRMWDAVAAVSGRVAPGGLFALALYNTQPLFTPVWKHIKRLYCAAPKPGRLAIAGSWAGICAVRSLAADLLRLRNPLARYTANASLRGMSFWRDVVDWVGGYPFETATPDEVARFLGERGFDPVNVRSVGGRLGCNEFLFRRREQA